MGAALLTVSSSLLCPHGGSVQDSPGSSRVQIGHQPVALKSDNFQIAGCSFVLPTVPPQPHPCIKIQWLQVATRVKAGGVEVLLQTSSGLCTAADQLPQGPPSILSTQSRVRGT